MQPLFFSDVNRLYHKHEYQKLKSRNQNRELGSFVEGCSLMFFKWVAVESVIAKITSRPRNDLAHLYSGIEYSRMGCWSTLLNSDIASSRILNPNETLFSK